MSFYFDRTEWNHYSELFLNGSDSIEVLEYFQRAAAFSTDLNIKITAHFRVAFMQFERGNTSAAKDGYLLVVSYRDNYLVDRKIIGSACNNLAYMYRYGIGVDMWLERAIELYRWGIKYANNERCKKALNEMGVSY